MMSGMPVGDVVPELVLLVGSVVVLIYALFAPRRAQAGAAGIALAAVLATGGAVGALASATRLTFAGTYALDAAATAAKLIILAVTAVVILLSIDWFRGDPRQGEYYALLLMSALGAVLLAGAADLMELVLAMLLSSATGYVLVAYHRASRRAAEAAIKYYLLGALTNGAMLYGVVLLFGLGATTTFGGLLARLPGADPVALVAGMALVVVGIAFKLGAVPAHAWMPDVADGGPAPVAAFVTAAPKVGALLALARLMAVLPESTAGWRPVIALVAALTMTLGNVAALWQPNVRRLLGWSAVSQTGYALMGVVALGRSPLAIPGLLYFLAAYVLGNLAAFGVVVTLRGRTELTEYAGLRTRHPWLALALAVSFFSFVGIPPLAGFAGKLALFGAAIDAGYGWLAVLAVINSVVSLAYYLRVLAPVYFDVAPSEDGGHSAAEAEGHHEGDGATPSVARTAWAAWATCLCAAALVLAGIGADLLLGALRATRLLPS